MLKSEPRKMVDGTMIVTYGLQHFDGQLPYFSITATISKYNREVSGGCLHDEIRKTFPELAELIPFHLCDSNGIPMHYVADAVYWAELATGVSKWHGKTTVPNGYNSFEDVLASHILADVLGDQGEIKDAIMLSKPDFEKWLNDRKERLFKAMKNTLASHNIAL